MDDHVPPDDGTCRECAQWQDRLKNGYYTWYRTCEDSCSHTHDHPWPRYPATREDAGEIPGDERETEE